VVRSLRALVDLFRRKSTSSSSVPVVVGRPQSEGGAAASSAASVHVGLACRSCSTDASPAPDVGPASDRGCCPLDGRISTTAAAVRRQSEPDYVNVMNRQQQQQQQLQQQGRWYADDSECMSELVPSAIYMNQHELAIAGRYTSRSTCNFMDPTANGNVTVALSVHFFRFSFISSFSYRYFFFSFSISGLLSFP